MIILLSPAKNLNFESVPLEAEPTLPRLTKDTELLIRRAQRLKQPDLKKLMKISESLADLNYHRFQALAAGLPEHEAKPAMFAFNGDVYRGLSATSLTTEDINWAQTHVRILSGLYGLLRPLDKIHPYRLEMGSRLDTRRGDSLYDFWGNRISRLINEDMSEDGGIVLNLASKEYSGVVDRKSLKTQIIDVDFLEERDGQSKIISFYAKYARGLMARWCIDNRVHAVETLKSFDIDGYEFSPDASSDKKLIFSRPQPELRS